MPGLHPRLLSVWLLALLLVAGAGTAAAAQIPFDALSAEEPVWVEPGAAPLAGLAAAAREAKAGGTDVRVAVVTAGTPAAVRQQAIAARNLVGADSGVTVIAIGQDRHTAIAAGGRVLARSLDWSDAGGAMQQALEAVAPAQAEAPASSRGWGGWRALVAVLGLLVVGLLVARTVREARRPST